MAYFSFSLEITDTITPVVENIGKALLKLIEGRSLIALDHQPLIGGNVLMVLFDPETEEILYTVL